MAGGCYTSARASGGRVWHAARHVRRLARDARLLGLGDVDPAEAARALAELAATAVGSADAKLRLEARRDAAGLRLVGAAQPLDPDPPAWRAVSATRPHPGASPTSSAKTTARAGYEAAFAEARRAGADEALLFDREGFLVEGARTNVVVRLADDALVTPPLARGAQAGVAREILLERVPELREGDVAADALDAAGEILAVNAVRGVRAIVALDGRPIADGRAGPCAARLHRAFLRGC